MPATRGTRYPYHLARLVDARLRALNLKPPPAAVLRRLFEILYFTSLKTDEGRQCLCTVNFVDSFPAGEGAEQSGSGRWRMVPFDGPLPLTVQALTKISKAADPQVSSLLVGCDRKGELQIWGMADREVRYSEFVSVDSPVRPSRPGLFQCAIEGVGNISASKDFVQFANLEQNALVEECHDVLWSGPVYELLRESFCSTCAEFRDAQEPAADLARFEDVLFVRRQNAVCRTLLNMQHYRHGGGLLIVPDWPAPEMHVKYQCCYDRLPQATYDMVRHQFLRRGTIDRIAGICQTDQDVVPCDVHYDSLRYHGLFDEHKNEVLGCTRFIASLSGVDGFVVMDRRLRVQAFGVEARADSELSEIHIAGDAEGTAKLLKPASLSQFGTRHRAMIRYCDRYDGALGFIVSQDGDIRATMKVGRQIVLWENINLNLAFRTENPEPPKSGIPAPKLGAARLTSAVRQEPIGN